MFPKRNYQPVTEVRARSPSYLASIKERWMNYVYYCCISWEWGRLINVWDD